MRRYVSRLYGNGATIIPKEVREALNIESGDLIVWRIDKRKKVAVVSVEKDILNELSKDITIKGRWTGKIFVEYISAKMSKK